jgi:2,5-diamino-6-(ribosylamino)-4(3H)-pyrimidinone 5'-phosphate reductase
LSTRLRDKEEKLLEILTRLAEESANGTPIVVEGKKDTETLRTLGIQGQIIMAKTGGKNLLILVADIESLGKKEVILLLDFDRRGIQTTMHLKQDLEKAKIKPDTTYWRALSALLSKEVKDVEGLATFMETLKSKNQ